MPENWELWPAIPFILYTRKLRLREVTAFSRGRDMLRPSLHQGLKQHFSNANVQKKIITPVSCYNAYSNAVGLEKGLASCISSSCPGITYAVAFEEWHSDKSVTLFPACMHCNPSPSFPKKWRVWIHVPGVQEYRKMWLIMEAQGWTWKDPSRDKTFCWLWKGFAAFKSL